MQSKLSESNNQWHKVNDLYEIETAGSDMYIELIFKSISNPLCKMRCTKDG